MLIKGGFPGSEGEYVIVREAKKIAIASARFKMIHEMRRKAKEGAADKNIKEPSGTLLYADTDGWDACLYPDRDPKDNPNDGNVCYRHSGGNEKSSQTDRGDVRDGSGRKGRFYGRANVAFIDSHVELRKKAPKSMFTLEVD